MKKLLLVLTLVFALTLTGCSSDNSQETSEVASSSEEETTYPEADNIFVSIQGNEASDYASLTDEQIEQTADFDHVLYAANEYSVIYTPDNFSDSVNGGLTIAGLSDFEATYQDNSEYTFSFDEAELESTANGIILAQDVMLAQEYKVGQTLSGDLDGETLEFKIVGTYEYSGDKESADYRELAYVGKSGYDTLANLYTNEETSVTHSMLIKIDSSESIESVKEQAEAAFGIGVDVYQAYISKDGIEYNIQ